MTEVKICGITTKEVWNHCLTLQVDYLGLMFYPKSPRAISLQDAATLSALPRKKSKVVAVFVNPNNDFLTDAIDHLRPDYIQLHGQETPTRLSEIKDLFSIPIIKALPIADESDFAVTSTYHAADIFLFDAKPRPEDTLPGGNAHSFNWGLMPQQIIQKPWFLAGGLNVSNVQEAVRISEAEKIDLSSGVESHKGRKSLEKISTLMRAITK